MIAYLFPFVSRKLLDLMEVTPRCLTNVCLGLKFGEILKLERNSFPPHFTDEKKIRPEIKSHNKTVHPITERERKKNISLKRNNLKGSMGFFLSRVCQLSTGWVPKEDHSGRAEGKVGQSVRDTGWAGSEQKWTGKVETHHVQLYSFSPEPLRQAGMQSISIQGLGKDSFVVIVSLNLKKKNLLVKFKLLY